MDIVTWAEKTFGSAYLFVAGGVFILLTLLLGLLIIPWIRRRYRWDDEPGPALDIESLERSLREGLITDEEFRRLRRIALGLDIKPANPDNSASSAPVGGDDEETETPPAEGSGPAGGDDEDRPQEE